MISTHHSPLTTHAVQATNHGSRIIAGACAALALCVSLSARAGEIQSGGPYVPTPQTVVDAMLEVAKVGPRDFVIDLGSGDGRIVLTAATKHRARGMGVEIEEELVEQANASAQRLGVADRVRFRRQDVMDADISGASVVTLYLMPGLMQSLQPRLLKELAPGTRIVSHDFNFGNWEPDRKVEVRTPEKYGNPGDWVSNVLLWIVPAAVEGKWSGEAGALRLDLRQRYQQFTGTLARGGAEWKVRGGRIEGARIRFSVPRADGSGRDLYTGVVKDSRIEGEVRGEGGTVTGRWSATRVK